MKFLVDCRYEVCAERKCGKWVLVVRFLRRAWAKMAFGRRTAGAGTVGNGAPRGMGRAPRALVQRDAGRGVAVGTREAQLQRTRWSGGRRPRSPTCVPPVAGEWQLQGRSSARSSSGWELTSGWGFTPFRTPSTPSVGLPPKSAPWILRLPQQVLPIHVLASCMTIPVLSVHLKNVNSSTEELWQPASSTFRTSIYVKLLHDAWVNPTNFWENSSLIGFRINHNSSE